MFNIDILREIRKYLTPTTKIYLCAKWTLILKPTLDEIKSFLYDKDIYTNVKYILLHKDILPEPKFNTIKFIFYRALDEYYIAEHDQNNIFKIGDYHIVPLDIPAVNKLDIIINEFSTRCSCMVKIHLGKNSTKIYNCFAIPEQFCFLNPKNVSIDSNQEIIVFTDPLYEI